MRDLRTVRTTAPGLFVVSILLVMSGSGECGKGLFQMTVRDAQTHLAVGADVRFEGPENRTERANAEGRAMPCLGPGEYQIEVSAPGYKTMRTHYRVSAGHNRMGVMLDPEVLPAPERPDAIARQTRTGFTLFHGYTVDEETGRPLAGVEVSFEHANVHTESGSDGHYALLVPTPRSEFPGGMGMDTLRFRKAGYKTLIFQNLGVGGDDMTSSQDMERGKGVIRMDATHKLLRK